MHKIKAAFDGSHRETGKARPVEVKPSWVIALENNDMPRLSELAKSEDGLLPHVFEGHVGSLEINGKVGRVVVWVVLLNDNAVDTVGPCVHARQWQCRDVAAGLVAGSLSQLSSPGDLLFANGLLPYL